MKPVTAVAGAAVLIAGFLVFSGVLSRAEEPRQQAQSTMVATIDLSPIQTELAALRTEMAAIRQAVADPKGLREDLAQTAAAAKALDARLAELGDTVKKEFEGIRPAIVALDPSTIWEYAWLKTRSETVMNRWGRDGWQLVTAGNDWLYFRRPILAGRKAGPPAEGGKEN